MKDTIVESGINTFLSKLMLNELQSGVLLMKVSMLRMVLLRRYCFVCGTTPLVFLCFSLTVTYLLTNIFLKCYTMKWVTTPRRPRPVAVVMQMAQLWLYNSTLSLAHRGSCFHCTAISGCCQCPFIVSLCWMSAAA